jgi:hypothetical protein
MATESDEEPPLESGINIDIEMEDKDELIANLRSQLQEYERLTATLVLDNSKLKDQNTNREVKLGVKKVPNKTEGPTTMTTLRTGDQIFLKYEGKNMFYKE